MSRKLLKSTAIVSVMTLISRVSGLVRDVVMANLLGTNALADAFFVAFRIPNFLRRIFAEGAFSQAFVPVFSELTAQNTNEAKRFVNTCAGVLALITFFISVLGVVFAPTIVDLLAPGFEEDPEKFNATVDALRIMFPYLFCISLVAMSAGVLNTLNRFAIPAVTPVLLNICLILAMLVVLPLFGNAAKTLAIGVMVAGVVQLLFQIPSIHKEGFLPRFDVDHQNPHARKVFTLMLPAVFSVSVAQINMLVNTYLASFLVTGSVSWLYYSDRLMEFPVGVFGIALATVVLPSLSKEHASGSVENFSNMLDWALRWVVIIAVPATAALYLLATPLLSTIFQYNAFNARDVVMSTMALESFSLGICGFIFVKVLAPGFFARKDTKTPMKIAIIAVVINVLLSIFLVKIYAHAGLALAISIAAWCNSAMLLIVLLYKNVFIPNSGWLWFLLRVLLAVVFMCLCLIALNKAPELWYAQTLWQRLADVALLIVSGMIVYFAALLLLGIRPQQLLLRPANS